MPRLEAWRVRCVFTTAQGPRDQTCIIASSTKEGAVAAAKCHMEKHYRVLEFLSATPSMCGARNED
jgi:hypothetical protein